MSEENKKKTFFKPSYFFWIVSVVVLIFVYIYSNNNYETINNAPNITEIHYADAITETHQKIIDKFNEKYYGRIKVIPINLPFRKFSTNERKELLARALRSKSEKIDLFSVDIVWGYRFEKYAEDLTDYFDESFLSKIIDPVFPTCYYDERLISVPLSLDLGTLYYREDKLSQLTNYKKLKTRIENSITWNEFIDLGTKLKHNNVPFYIYPASDYEGLICSFMELVLNQNRDFFSGDRIDLLQPESRKALQTLYDLIHKYKFTPKVVTAFTEHPAYQYYVESGGYFIRSWPTFFSENIVNLNEEAKSKIKRAPLPHFKGTKPAAVFGGWNLIVSKFSENKPEVIEFIKFVLQHDSQKLFFEENGSLPVIRSVYEDSTVANYEVLDFYEQQFEYGVHRPLLVDYSRISDIISYFIHKVLNNELEIEAALSEATKMVNSKEVIFK
ncbi:MAG: extracellular solute-binding protein [Melioribacteraceae bacterium]|nr:extracellular solute-binding protein [Melioribacteraceae bacterium]